MEGWQLLGHVPPNAHIKIRKRDEDNAARMHWRRGTQLGRRPPGGFLDLAEDHQLCKAPPRPPLKQEFNFIIVIMVLQTRVYY